MNISKTFFTHVKCYKLMCTLISAVPCTSTGMLSHSWGQLEYLEKSIGVVTHFAFVFFSF